MKLLYIDTSSSYLYAGIVDNDSILCEIKKEFGHNLSEEALPEIARLFTEHNIAPNQIEKIIAVDGPGSFTGIRIGITIAKVYAWGLKIPITSISALEAMSISSTSNRLHVPIIDARRGYVYGAIYTKDSEEILKPQHMRLTDLLANLEHKEFVFITNDEFEISESFEKYNPDILKIVEKCKNREGKNPHAINPNYLKLTEAEESKIK